MMTSRDYVLQPKLLSGSRPKIINLARNYNYQTDGYYASLLAEARGHRVVPTVETMLDLYDRELPEDTISVLEELLNKDVGRNGGGGQAPERLVVCFGETQDERFRKFGRQLFDWYRAPVLVVTTSANGQPGKCKIKRIKLTSFTRLEDNELRFFVDSLTTYTGRVWKNPKARTIPKWSIAVLHDPGEQLAPSSVESLQHWARLAEKDGVEIEPITRKDIDRLAEFDALMIRETTSITNHTYRFARRAWAEGMPVIDDPVSMMRCTNKVYLWERLIGAGLPAPETIIIQDKTNLQEVADRLKFPVVVKIPDGSFSRGIKKAEHMDELRQVVEAFLEGLRPLHRAEIRADGFRLACGRARQAAAVRLPVQDGARTLADTESQGGWAIDRRRAPIDRRRGGAAGRGRHRGARGQPDRRRLLRGRYQVGP